jgi:hypothetical protein
LAVSFFFGVWSWRCPRARFVLPGAEARSVFSAAYMFPVWHLMQQQVRLPYSCENTKFDATARN